MIWLTQSKYSLRRPGLIVTVHLTGNYSDFSRGFFSEISLIQFPFFVRRLLALTSVEGGRIVGLQGSLLYLLVSVVAKRYKFIPCKPTFSYPGQRVCIICFSKIVIICVRAVMIYRGFSL